MLASVSGHVGRIRVTGLGDSKLNSRNMNVGRVQGVIVGLLEVERYSEMEINVGGGGGEDLR